MKKYNIALLPVDKGAAFIDVSQKFSMMDPVYNLGEKSLPHVTLCQFYQEEREIEAIWEKICDALSDHALDLEFKNFSLITFDNKMFWISLLPDASSELHQLQAEVAALLKVSSKRPYDPHLTLISTLDSKYEGKAVPFIKDYQPIADKFILALGECDELGQFIRIIHQKELRETIALTI